MNISKLKRIPSKNFRKFEIVWWLSTKKLIFSKNHSRLWFGRIYKDVKLRSEKHWEGKSDMKKTLSVTAASLKAEF